MAVALVISYLAFSLPAVLAGFASTSVGLRPTAVVYGLAVVGARRSRRSGSPRGAPEPSRCGRRGGRLTAAAAQPSTVA